ncbi:MAG: LPS assembly lipoprotein LptE [Spiribacter sp.]|jgi:LPS-assembly lipoprotein|nr:LPS assembly lipoprotein LptE [Spiribacter sp.]MDR9489548.1 LPS assembly lipoprotein LptE [Spiribacter sp.]
MNGLKQSMVVVLAVVLAGCGWQLRGSAGGGFEDVAIALTGSAGNRLESQVARRLSDLGADVVASADDAEVLLDIDAADTQRREVATDADDFASEYELTVRLTFALLPGELAAPDWQATPAQSVQARSAYSFDPNALQAAQAEEEAIERDLRRDAIALMLARIGRVL